MGHSPIQWKNVPLATEIAILNLELIEISTILIKKISLGPYQN